MRYGCGGIDNILSYGNTLCRGAKTEQILNEAMLMKVLKYITKNPIQILIAIAILGILAVVITTVLLD